MKIEVQPIPYSLIVLHALKYPHTGVCGLLLGKKNGSHVQIHEAVPISHETNPLSPTLEIAVTLVHSRKPDIIGVYFANKDFGDRSISNHIAKLAEKIGSVNNLTPLVLQLVNTQLSSEMSRNCMTAHVKEEDSWKENPLEISSDCLSSLNSAIDNKLHRSVVDFDNHLDKPELDFFNSDLVSAIV